MVLMIFAHSDGRRCITRDGRAVAPSVLSLPSTSFDASSRRDAISAMKASPEADKKRVKTGPDDGSALFTYRKRQMLESQGRVGRGVVNRMLSAHRAPACVIKARVYRV